MDYFRLLPESCISVIVSDTSPKDAATSSTISRAFMSAAESNVVWETFLPCDYQHIISRSKSFLISPSKKQLYLSLSDSPILLDGGKQSFSLDKKTGKKCFMVAARELAISWGDSTQYWKWSSHPNSRFLEVAKLQSVCWLDIRGKIETRILSKRSKYGVYLVFELAEGFYGLETANAYVRLVDRVSDDEAEQRASSVCFSTRLGSRTDGWLEVKLGNFFNDRGEDGDVEARLMETKRLSAKGGLIIQGIEFRPD